MPFLNVSENGDNFANDFYGGNLEGVRQKLPYLKEMGCLYSFVSPLSILTSKDSPTAKSDIF